MDRQAIMARRIRALRSQAVAAPPSRELREPSLEGAQSSRVRRRVRSERGQAAVEFALVVPLLCLIIIAILHFGKVMNYWLDLNHVASEGARKVSVITFDTYGEYDGYVRGRLETGELRSGGTTSIPAPAAVAVCLPEGSDVGDPVTVQVSAGYSLPFIGSTITLRGSATMRLEQTAPAGISGGTCV
ncbi:MAG TPA: TadE family protein [Gaiellaceae bacterium]|nr:TadE family protein [Gaiellaceae bacterium]